MTAQQPSHHTFTIERTYNVATARVFAAFADVQAKSKWFGATDNWQLTKREFDFRVGGHEELCGSFNDGKVTAFKADYYDIVTDQRIVYAYEMFVNERRISVSLATILLTPTGKGTRLAITEQGVFFNGIDDATSRERGTVWLIDRLEQALELV